MGVKECGQNIENPDPFLDQLCPATWSVRHVYSLKFSRSLNNKERADEMNNGSFNLFQHVMGVRNTEIFGCFYIKSLESHLCICSHGSSGAPQSRGLEAAGLGSSGLDCCLLTITPVLTASWVYSYSENSGFFGAFISPGKL